MCLHTPPYTHSHQSGHGSRGGSGRWPFIESDTAPADRGFAKWRFVNVRVDSRLTRTAHDREASTALRTPVKREQPSSQVAGTAASKERDGSRRQSGNEFQAAGPAIETTTEHGMPVSRHEQQLVDRRCCRQLLPGNGKRKFPQSGARAKPRPSLFVT